jgi:hypothetical protein
MSVRYLKMRSSALEEVIYASKLERLFVKFHNGVCWEYEGITQEEADALESAESQGRYFRQNIRTKKGRRV